MGPQVMLRADVITPGKPMRYEFMAFGGSFIDAALRKDIAKCGEHSLLRPAKQTRITPVTGPGDKGGKMDLQMPARCTASDLHRRSFDGVH
jgi:hypothetical protein